jgi:hypothetical protein
VRGPATGISLARTTTTTRAIRPGTVVWLVSLDPKIQPRLPGKKPPDHQPVRRAHRMNYFVVAVDAYSGRILESQGGYDPKLSRRA